MALRPSSHFELNGEVVEIPSDCNERTLLEFLRENQRLVGTKEGCAEGDCGACTVLRWHQSVDETSPRWQALNACILPMGALAGAAIRTIESLHQVDEHPLVPALVQHAGAQCGFCTPGIVMTLIGRAQVPAAKRANLDVALSGNICRCTGYQAIRQAVAAVEHVAAPSLPAPEFVGTRRDPATHPETLASALLAKKERPAARFVAGATDLALEWTVGDKPLGDLIYLDAVQELRAWQRDENGWTIGAGLTVAEFARLVSRDFAQLTTYLDRFGSPAIRRRATVGGNLVNASPIGDLAPFLLAVDATVEIATHNATKIVPMQDFFTGYRSCVVHQEPSVLVAVRFALPKATTSLMLRKISRRRDMDISILSCALALDLDASNQVSAIRIAYGGIADRPMRLTALEKLVTGQVWNLETVESAIDWVESNLRPLDDHRASAVYRRQAAAGLLMAAFQCEVQP